MVQAKNRSVRSEKTNSWIPASATSTPAKISSRRIAGVTTRHPAVWDPVVMATSGVESLVCRPSSHRRTRRRPRETHRC